MSGTTKIKEMIDFAKSKIDIPYIWGGQSDEGYDCSGFVITCLQHVGLYPKGEDNTAQGIYIYLFSQLWREADKEGSICFFSKSKRHIITHVGIMLGNGTFIGANGGNSLTKNAEIARLQGAKVDIRNVRRDLVAVLYPPEKLLGVKK